jgi:hypothetical protein
LASVNIDLFVKNRSSLRDLNVEKLKVLNFTEESNQDWVKVDS